MLFFMNFKFIAIKIPAITYKNAVKLWGTYLAGENW